MDQDIPEADGIDIFSIILLHHPEWYFPLPMELEQRGTITAGGEILTITPGKDQASGADFTTVPQKFSKIIQFLGKFSNGREVIEEK